MCTRMLCSMQPWGAAGAQGPELTIEQPPRVFERGDYELVGVKYRNSPFMDPRVTFDGNG